MYISHVRYLYPMSNIQYLTSARARARARGLGLGLGLGQGYLTFAGPLLYYLWLDRVGW